ncbi:MAG: flagellar biosynthesis protein [Gemmobacter sp.]|nr:flagellar biosynthesis protein [Gemmobacter sp.]
MIRRLQLEVFETETIQNTSTVVMDGSELEEARLVSFESGYKAGWDDAVAAQTDDQMAQRDEIARALQGLSFTYHEARNHILRALKPLVTDIASRFLPDIARASLPHMVAETLMPFAEMAAEAPIRVHLHPSSRLSVEELLGTDPGLPLILIEESSLSPGQVWIRLGDQETQIDLDGALTAIRTVLDDFFSAAKKDYSHG